MATQFDQTAAFSGGGFMPSQTTQSADPGFSPAKNRDAQTLLPLTIKQINDGYQATDHKTDIQIDGVDVHTVRIMGMMVRKEDKVTDVSIVVDDGTGCIECNIWLDGPADTNRLETLHNGMYVTIHGKLNVFQGKKKVTIFNIRPVTDFDEIAYHFANCIYVHCYNTRLLKTQDASQVPGYMSSAQKMQGVGQVPGHVSNSSFNTPLKGYDSTPANNLSVHPDRDSQLILDLLMQRDNISGVHGLHRNDIAHITKIPEPRLTACLEQLAHEGSVYSTLDDNHFKSTVNG